MGKLFTFNDQKLRRMIGTLVLHGLSGILKVQTSIKFT